MIYHDFHMFYHDLPIDQVGVFHSYPFIVTRSPGCRLHWSISVAAHADAARRARRRGRGASRITHRFCGIHLIYMGMGQYLLIPFLMG